MKKFLIIIPIIFTLFFLFTAKIQAINCQINQSECNQTELALIESILKNQSLFFYNIQEDLNNNQEFNKQFILTNYSKELNGNINLVIIKQEPLYQVKLDKQSYLVTKQGYLLKATVPVPKLPLVTWSQPPSNLITSQKITVPVHQELVQLLTQLNKDEVLVKEINWLSNEEIRVNLVNNLEFILDKKSLSNKASVVKLISNSKEIEALEQAKKVVDLRFKLPVLHITQ